MTNHRALLLSPLYFVVALLTLVGLGASSAAASSGPETRVRAFDTPVEISVAASSSERPASVGRVGPETAGMVVGSCVATEAAGGGTTRVYRVEGPGNARLDISPAGEVGIKGDNTLFLNFGDEARAQSFLDRRLSQGFEGTQIKSFEVPTSYVDELRASAVPESMARQFPNSPMVVDVNQAADQFGLRACQFGALQAAIVPGSGRMGC